MDEQNREWTVAVTLKSGVVVEQQMTLADYKKTSTEIVDFWTNEESVETYVVFGYSMVKTTEIAALSYGGELRRESTL